MEPKYRIVEVVRKEKNVFLVETKNSMPYGSKEYNTIHIMGFPAEFETWNDAYNFLQRHAKGTQFNYFDEFGKPIKLSDMV